MRFIYALAASAAITMATPASAATVFTDGFEGDTPALTVTTLDNWTVTQGVSVDVVGASNVYSIGVTLPASGNVVDLDGTPGPATITSIQNFHERAVYEAVETRAKRFPHLATPELLADIACVALNRLPPRYIRHEVDFAFYLTDKERGEISAVGQNSRYNSVTIDEPPTIPAKIRFASGTAGMSSRRPRPASG